MDKEALYKSYIEEAVDNLIRQNNLKGAFNDIKASVKDSEFDTKQFLADVKAAFDIDKAENQLSVLSKAVEVAKSL